VKLGQDYNSKKSIGVPQVLTGCEKKAILRAVSSFVLSVLGILNQRGVNTNICNVLLKRTPTLIRKNFYTKTTIKQT